MNLRTNTHRNSAWRTDVPSCDKHLQNPEDKCNEHYKFTIIEKKQCISTQATKRKSFRTQGRFFDT